LQSEFTKRCQKLKELENKLAVQSEKQSTTVEVEKEQPNIDQDITLQNKEQILKDYLCQILGKKSNSIVMDGAGVGVKTPVSRPKTFEEAGKLAKEIFKN
jgi:soluble P-type ATPase